MVSVERVRAAWTRAAQFPANKEAVYPEHAFAQEFDLQREVRVLEYGCGGGSDAMSYLRRGCTVWYVDIVPENVEAARRRIVHAELNAKAYPYVVESSDEIRIMGAYFDVVNSHGVLHHIEDPLPVLREFRRLLKPDGKLYVMLYTEHLWNHHLPSIRDLVKMRQLSEAEAFGWCTDGQGVPYARAYTQQEGDELLESAGFKPDRRVLYNMDHFRTFRAVPR